MQSGERDREANSFGVEASLTPTAYLEVGIPRYARNDTEDGNHEGHTSSLPRNPFVTIETAQFLLHVNTLEISSM